MPARSARHTAILDALDAGVIVLDADRRITVWNEWMVAAARRARGDVLGKTLEAAFPGIRFPRLLSAVEDALHTGSSSLLTHALHPILLPLLTRAGIELIHNIAVRPLAEKPYAACILQVFDVTVATERERVLRARQNARYDAVVASAADAILTIDEAGLIQLANPAAELALGYSAKELIGWPIARLLEPADAWHRVWRSLWRAEPLHWPIELLACRKDGSRSFIDATASRWQSGAGMFVTVILRDVNERRAAEATLRQLNDTLEERVRLRTAELEVAHEQLRQSQKMEAIGQLTGGIAHDFNNLLTPILGGLDILQRRGVDDPRGQRLIEGALQSAERARVLVQRLLAFARQQPLQLSPVNVGEVVRGMSELVGSTLGPRVRIVLDLDDSLPCALADANQLEMALLNLVVNARDAMPDGGAVSIAARVGEWEGGGGLRTGRYISLSVSDTGVGMDPETMSRAIEPFFSTKGIGKGTGLGLSMIHGLAAQLGGRLDLASTPGVGTTVQIWLPVAEGGALQARTTATSLVGEVPGAGVVLLVDDEEVIRTTTSQMLSDLGYTVIEVGSAREALLQLSDPRLTLMVTDHLMPGMSGTELARRCGVMRPHLPILIISGYAEVEDVAPDLPRLMKPFRETELAVALAQLKFDETARPAG